MSVTTANEKFFYVLGVMQNRYSRMEAVQDPIIPLVGRWIGETSGTLSLGQGIVGYPPPPQVYEAIASFAQQPDAHRYQSVQGIEPLRQVLLQKVRRENELVVAGLHQLVVTAGSNMGFMNAVLAITQPGDEIIIQTPYYFNHEMAIRMAGCVPVLVPTSQGRSQLELEAIASAITPGTRAIVTISPNNPTGVVYAPTDLAAVNRLCGDRGLYHISDEAYEYFVYGNTPHCSPGRFDRGQNHTISLFSLSKAYGFASWRIGYMVIPEQLQLAIQKIQDTILICPPVISQYAALAAVTAGWDYVKPRIRMLAAVRSNLLEALGALGESCWVPNPEGALYVFLRIQRELDSMDLVERLIRQYRVAVIPGTAFGVAGCSVRIAYGALQAAEVEMGMTRLVKGMLELLDVESI